MIELGMDFAADQHELERETMTGPIQDAPVAEQSRRDSKEFPR